jgi:hypothetical protein
VNLPPAAQRKQGRLLSSNDARGEQQMDRRRPLTPRGVRQVAMDRHVPTMQFDVRSNSTIRQVILWRPITSIVA